jgi:hypothetical protein
MKYIKSYQADSSGPSEGIDQVLDRLRRIFEELVSYCEGDVSCTSLPRVAVDLAACLVGPDGLVPEETDLCCELLPEGDVLMPLELREHGKGMDLADVLGMLDAFGNELAWLGERGAELLHGHAVEMSVELVLVTRAPALAARFGFRAA